MSLLPSGSAFNPAQGIHVELTGLSTFLFLMILGFHHHACINSFYLDLGAISVSQASVNDQSSLGKCLWT